MIAEEKGSSAQKRPIILPPALVVLAALVLYGITLNHWVTFSDLPLVAKITGWDWHPMFLDWRPSQFMPLFYVLTSPIRIFPVGWQPFLLNAFSALCAALTLGLLAASVRLLPQDRTREQRQREGGEFALLSVRGAFLPALFAVLVMGLQMTFWRDAISTSVDTLDLLVFAFLIFCLLKFRVTQNDGWLAGFTFIYGLGTTNNWALIAFAPLFFVAMVWIKGVNFFNLRFLGRMLGCGVLGLLLYLLLPAIASLGSERANFFTMLHQELGAQSFGMRQIPRWVVLVAALPTLLPLIFAGITWPSFEGELSASGTAVTKFMFRLLHVFFLVLALSMFIDFKYSPSVRLQEVPVGFLTFFYLGALCVGYFSGYILLVFGKSTGQSWDRRGPLMSAFNRLIAGLLWLLATGAPCAMLITNGNHIMEAKNGLLQKFADETIRDLPSKPAVVLADDPSRLYLLDAAYRRAGKPNPNILIDTGSLPHREYIAYLISRYPEIKKLTKTADKLPPMLWADSLIQYLYGLGQSGLPIYYLHPSFGYYFELFYLRPHGLVYEFLPYPKGVIAPPAPLSAEVMENQAILTQFDKSLGDIPALAKKDPNSELVAVNVSVALDFWGVTLQRAGYLKEANAWFTEALRLNPNNFIAKINRTYNERLQKGDYRVVDTGNLIFKAINMYRGMVRILKFNGPVDEPGLALDFGAMMADGHDYRQAVILFQRRLQLLPDDVPASIDLAKTYVDWGAPDKAIELVQKLRVNSKANKWEVSRVEALAYYAKHDFPAAEELLAKAYREDPNDENRIALLAEFYRLGGYGAMRDANLARLHTNNAVYTRDMQEAGRRFTNAMVSLDAQVKLLVNNNHNNSDPFGLPETLLKKAEVQMMVKDFEGSIVTLTDVINRQQPANPTAVLNRAIAEVQVNKLREAKADYESLRKLLPNQTYVVYFGLADVARKENDKGEEIRNLKIYLKTAPADAPEVKQVKERLKKLEGT